jgi:hypothetical protein
MLWVAVRRGTTFDKVHICSQNQGNHAHYLKWKKGIVINIKKFVLSFAGAIKIYIENNSR